MLRKVEPDAMPKETGIRAGMTTRRRQYVSVGGGAPFEGQMRL